MKAYFDLHIHSVLSLCASDDMTPCNIAGMASLAGLNVVAVSDHNSARNCRAFAAAAKEFGIVAVPAIELTTSEEVHVLCLFYDVVDAEKFSDFIRKDLPEMTPKMRENWKQQVMDESDILVGEEEKLLSIATSIGIYDVVKTVAGYGGIAIAAHIDRSSYSISSNLGLYDEAMGFSLVEFSREADKNKVIALSPVLATIPHISNSDAHDLEMIPNAKYYVEVDELSVFEFLEKIKAGKIFEDIG